MSAKKLAPHSICERGRPLLGQTEGAITLGAQLVDTATRGLRAATVTSCLPPTRPAAHEEQQAHQ